MKRLVAWLMSGVVLAGLLITLLIPPAAYAADRRNLADDKIVVMKLRHEKVLILIVMEVPRRQSLEGTLWLVNTGLNPYCNGSTSPTCTYETLNCGNTAS